MHVLCITDMDQYRIIGRISRTLDFMLDNMIGSEVIINVRRTTTDLRDDLYRLQSELSDFQYIPVYSGSKAEGLRFKSSDDDWMLIDRYIKVIPADSYIAKNDSNTTLLLMEDHITKPGFTLLKLIGESTMPEVTTSIEHILNGRYVSCKRWRELHTSKWEFTHGPCASATVGICEYDAAFCLKCDIWPAYAQGCIRRLHQSVWPSHEIILSIVNDGVLFVPIGAKQSSFENIEWRMSFSLAEKKLIDAMNHTQFLCYGLMKIFLKEAVDVNPDVKGLLCSYFLKTVLFWEIATARKQWTPSTLMSCFWKCFQRLLQWVSCSYCPNFFIPENNMFVGKIEGRNREKLLQYMRTLYYEGYTCFLRCPSLSNAIMPFIIYRDVEVILGNEHQNTVAIGREIIKESCLALDIYFYKYHIASTSIHVLSVLMFQFANIRSIHERFILKTWLHRYLTNYSLSGTTSSTENGCNKSNYRNLTERMNILGRSRTDSVSHFLYQAMLCYNNGRYTRALRLVQQTKEKMSDPRSIYCYEASEINLRKAGLDHLPIRTVLRRHFLESIQIDDDKNIQELYFELCTFHKSTKEQTRIPPLVFAFFLQFLCQRKLCYLRKADDALYELTILVKHYDGHHVAKTHEDMTWQILGISQQISGDDQAAFRSFMRAQQLSRNYTLKFAISTRIGIILVKYFYQFLNTAVVSTKCDNFAKS